MKDIWYGDKRDIVKWGGIIHLCSEKEIRNVVQVAYYREQEKPELVFDNREVPLPKSVMKHFRDIERIQELGDKIGLKITVCKEEFSHETRSNYHKHMSNKVKRLNSRKIVLLDPDVGLKTTQCKAEHVTPKDVEMIWQSLDSGDILVLYQHSFRSFDWRKIRKNELAKACDVKVSRVGAWQAKHVPQDVAFLFVEKVKSS